MRNKMQILWILVQTTIFFNTSCKGWEYCKSNIQNKLCGERQHFVCDPEGSLSNPSNRSKEFLAHVPLSRKIKTSFLNWHNYYRNRIAGGYANNGKIYFPKAVRMRELIWDTELSYLSHVRTKSLCSGEVQCRSTHRFPFVGQNLIVEPSNVSKPVLEIIALALRKMFDTKNFIIDPEGMPKQFLDSNKNANQFITMVNDRVSRLGCAVALGAACGENENSFKFCYYTACSYDEDNEGFVYKIGQPAGRCSRWEVRRSKTYIYLCANSGKIFEREN